MEVEGSSEKCYLKSSELERRQIRSYTGPIER